jgi:TM2 domain-containing membrane protein YozV
MTANDIPKVKKNWVKKIFKFKKEQPKHSRFTAATFDITLGLLGVHRLYLGTKPSVPMIYTMTLGGAGFLVVADLGVILFSKDLEKFANNDHVFMLNIK